MIVRWYEKRAGRERREGNVERGTENAEGGTGLLEKKW
jgi:hypothetical protein